MTLHQLGHTVTLNQLVYMAALAELRSFTQAADRCAITQPALSNSIAALERELGGMLFTRNTRKAELTPLGKRLLPSVERVLSAVGALESEANAFLNPERKLIRIGVSPLVDSRMLLSLLEPYRETHPDVELLLDEANLVDLQAMLIGEMADSVVAPAQGTSGRQPAKGSPGLVRAVIRMGLYGEDLYYVPKRPPQTGHVVQKPMQLHEIAHETFVMVPDGCGLARATRELFRRRRRPLKECQRSAKFPTLVFN